MQPSRSIMSTPVGDVTVDLEPSETFIADNYRWPYGLALVPGAAPGEAPRPALPMHDGDRVMWGFKLQQEDFATQECDLACYQDRAYIAAGVAGLARSGWRGTLVAGTHQRPKGSFTEVGIALFIVPELPYSAPGGAFNIAFEAAQWKTIEHFINPSVPVTSTARRCRCRTSSAPSTTPLPTWATSRRCSCCRTVSCSCWTATFTTTISCGRRSSAAVFCS